MYDKTLRFFRLPATDFRYERKKLRKYEYIEFMSMYFSESPEVGMTGGTLSRTQIYVIGTVFVGGGFPTVPPSLALSCGSQRLRALGSLSTKSGLAALLFISCVLLLPPL